jgi:uncharacterized repeat protein (TIGR03833 family)
MFSLNGGAKATGRNMDGKTRANIKPGLTVLIVLKQDQRTGKLTKGIVQDILNNPPGN